ncbi:hypothetical protein SteCoe_34939 [Stentor coeruleus]|uniref:C2H2-type domain-containing protein n=1 Tax=Stentor coeruleus TaxID=5963 RepID=A0A1R2ATE5_9CILI|nr:hypothetical protein SteCoe_34939 [Stentor coeruleus]
MSSTTSKDPKIFSCDICDKTFIDKSKLARHSLVHTKEKPFKCAYCHKLFSLDYNLRTHLRVHSGDKPFICRVTGCNKRFSQSSNMKVHERSHIRTDRRISSPKESTNNEEIIKPENIKKEEQSKENVFSDIEKKTVKIEEGQSPDLTSSYDLNDDSQSFYGSPFTSSYLEF